MLDQCGAQHSTKPQAKAKKRRNDQPQTAPALFNSIACCRGAIYGKVTCGYKRVLAGRAFYRAARARDAVEESAMGLGAWLRRIVVSIGIGGISYLIMLGIMVLS